MTEGCSSPVLHFVELFCTQTLLDGRQESKMTCHQAYLLNYARNSFPFTPSTAKTSKNEFLPREKSVRELLPLLIVCFLLSISFPPPALDSTCDVGRPPSSWCSSISIDFSPFDLRLFHPATPVRLDTHVGFGAPKMKTITAPFVQERSGGFSTERPSAQSKRVGVCWGRGERNDRHKRFLASSVSTIKCSQFKQQMGTLGLDIRWGGISFVIQYSRYKGAAELWELRKVPEEEALKIVISRVYCFC